MKHLPAAERPRHLELHAVFGAREFPCFWARGIIPAVWTEVQEPPDVAVVDHDGPLLAALFPAA
eukprot:11216911-Lingulodinium_polyedra.AAC.1